MFDGFKQNFSITIFYLQNFNCCFNSSEQYCHWWIIRKAEVCHQIFFDSASVILARSFHYFFKKIRKAVKIVKLSFNINREAQHPFPSGIVILKLSIVISPTNYFIELHLCQLLRYFRLWLGWQYELLCSFLGWCFHIIYIFLLLLFYDFINLPALFNILLPL